MAPSPSPRVELYVRSLTCRTGQREQIIRRLDRLDAAGHVDGVSCRVWGEAVTLSPPVSETEPARSLLDSVAEFRQWAAGNDASLDSLFQHATVDCQLTGETRPVLRLPTVAMAEYVDGRLRQVTPHESDGVVRVTDRIDALDPAGSTVADGPSRQSP